MTRRALDCRETPSRAIINTYPHHLCLSFLLRMNCFWKLQECGYSPHAARKVSAKLIKRGIISGQTVSAVELQEALRDLCSGQPRGHQEIQLHERRKMMMSDLESQQLSSPHTQCSEPGPEPPAPDFAPADPPSEALHRALHDDNHLAADASELCALLGVQEVVRVRTTGEGADKKFSLVDVARLVSGKLAKDALRDVRVVMEQFQEVTHAVRNLQFPGPGQRMTPVGDLRTTLLVVLRLRSRVAQKLSAKVVDVFVRFVGGDPALAQEVLADPVFQAQLAVEQPLAARVLLDAAAPPSEVLAAASAAPPTDAAELCTLLGVQEAVRVRTTGEGADKKFSLVDVTRLVTGKEARPAAEDVRVVMKDFCEVDDAAVHFQFAGQGQRPTPVGDLRTTLLVVLRLRSRVAQKLSAKVADVFVRYLGGDPALAHEILTQEDFRALLAEDQPLASRVLLASAAPASEALLQASASRGTDASELCTLLGVQEAVRVRTMGEGADKKFSLVDVARLVSGKSTSNALRDVRVVLEQFEEVTHDVSNLQFPGVGQRPTPVGDLRTTLLVVLRLRSRVTQKLSAKVVDVFVRYLGGDPALAEATLRNREWQEHLAREDPEHPARVFGEAVESRVPPAPLQFHEAPELEGGTHLYALRSQAYPRLFKTGSGKDPFERLFSEERKHNGRLRLYLQAIFWNEGHLEFLARRHLCETPPEEWAIQGTEYRLTSEQEIQEATALARGQHALMKQRPVENDDDRQAKRQRTRLELEKDEFMLHKARVDFMMPEERAHELRKKQIEIMLPEERTHELQERRASSRPARGWTHGCGCTASSRSTRGASNWSSWRSGSTREAWKRRPAGICGTRRRRTSTSLAPSIG